MTVATDVSAGLLIRFECGKNNVSAVALVAIANALGVTPAALFRPDAMPKTTRERPSMRPAVA
ncbi:helix-turn-helix domain-containing protein [Sorangium sp. So ce1504]|uniref:helix-turn-helix domain-containing protein n=1 Tax=Sorangium sp. So ce1504 TaxID=3133337 RepID=UPI003F60A650